uniref:Uncharacterized protein n=1 Tax=Anguilla anguilla TaxID=7936 RepID=A0A0E9WZP0_ANGAN
MKKTKIHCQAVQAFIFKVNWKFSTITILQVLWSCKLCMLGHIFGPEQASVGFGF